MTATAPRRGPRPPGKVPSPADPPPRSVIAVVLQWREKIALFKRSPGVQSDQGRWHCITGFLEPGLSPSEQALEELREEAGLRPADLTELAPGPTLLLEDSRGACWAVYTFTAVTARRRLEINWEHTSFRWTSRRKAKRFSNRVPWLDAVLEATGRSPAQPGRCPRESRLRTPRQTHHPLPPRSSS